MNEERAKEILEELGWKGIDKPNDVEIAYSDTQTTHRTGDAPSMNNLADLCRECELPRKTRELEAENAELKERSRWRDAEKELPSYHYPAERDKPTIEFLVITDPYVVELFSGQYNPKSKEYIMERGFPITGGPDVVYWRPFSMPEYRNCVGGTKGKHPLDLPEAKEESK